MSEEKREILEHLVEYLQQKIDSGEHKIFFNDLMWDEKTIDCINAINNTLEEIERLNNIINELETYIGIKMSSFGICNARDIYYKLQELKGSNEPSFEEDKKIEKLELVSNGNPNSYALLNEYGTKCGLTKHSKVMCDKINEIIDKLNEMENK